MLVLGALNLSMLSRDHLQLLIPQQLKGLSSLSVLSRDHLQLLVPQRLLRVCSLPLAGAVHCLKLQCWLLQQLNV